MEQIAQQENLHLSVFSCDILEESDRKALGELDIDVYIGNAAIGNSGSVCEIPITYVREVFETNIFANFATLQIIFQKMMQRGKNGRIILLSSMAGRIPMPFLSPYCASKAAIETFMTCLRTELIFLKGCSIQVAIIEPGAYATGFNKENNEKKYSWMRKHSYFLPILSKLQKIEKKVWNFLEQKPYTSIIQKYVTVVECKHLKYRYVAPWWQALFIQLGRTLGL